LDWVGVAPAPQLKGALGVDVWVGNEADLAAGAVAEIAPGRAGRLADFLYVSGGSGVGGAVVVDGEVHTGSRGWAGEIGHVCVDPAGPACGCGSTGCHPSA
jgi:predicted NBD/HSP70 family sugar kinase